MKPTGQAPPDTSDEQDVAETYDAEELGAEYPPRSAARGRGLRHDAGRGDRRRVGGRGRRPRTPGGPGGRRREQIVAVEPEDAGQERKLVGEVVDAPAPEPGADQEDPAGRLGRAAVAAEDAALHTEESAIGSDVAARRGGDRQRPSGAGQRAHRRLSPSHPRTAPTARHQPARTWDDPRPPLEAACCTAQLRSRGATPRPRRRRRHTACRRPSRRPPRGSAPRSA